MVLSGGGSDAGAIGQAPLEHRLEPVGANNPNQPKCFGAVTIPLAAIGTFALGVVVVAGVIARRPAGRTDRADRDHCAYPRMGLR